MATSFPGLFPLKLGRDGNEVGRMGRSFLLPNKIELKSKQSCAAVIQFSHIPQNMSYFYHLGLLVGSSSKTVYLDVYEATLKT